MGATNQNGSGCTKFELPSYSIEYVESEIEKGIDLSAILAETMPWRSGNTFTFLPSDMPRNEVDDYRRGVFGRPLSAKVRSAFHNFAREYLLEVNRGVLFLEDRESGSGDSWYEEMKAEHVICNGRLYWYCEKPEAEKIELTFGMAESACALNGVLAVLPPEIELHHRAEITVEQLKAIAALTRFVVVSAYDGALYVIWEKSIA